MKMIELKEILKRALERAENYSDDDEVKVHCNTCHIGIPMLEVHSGFIDLKDLLADEDEEDDE